MAKSKVKTFHYPTSKEDGPFYQVESDVVTWRGYDMLADPKTFVALTDCWGMDSDSVYIQDRKQRKIDRSTFRLLNPVFAVDRNAVYDWSGVIKGADAKTFEALDSGVIHGGSSLFPEVECVGYGRDRTGIWFHEQMFGRASLIKTADRKSFVSLRNGYGADATNVFFGKAKLAGADPATWLPMGHGYSMDYRYVWFQNRKIKDVDRESFVVLEMPDTPSLATDGARYFRNDSVIDAKKFKAAVGDELQAAKRHVQSLK